MCTKHSFQRMSPIDIGVRRYWIQIVRYLQPTYHLRVRRLALLLYIRRCVELSQISQIARIFLCFAPQSLYFLRQQYNILNFFLFFDNK